MSPAETIAYAVLWIILFALALLVLVLYRQVEKAYRRSGQIQAAGLVPGTVAPDLEILTDDGIAPLEVSPDGQYSIFAFITTACESCARLVKELRAGVSGADRVVFLASGETREYFGADDGVEIQWVAHPGSAVRDWVVSVVPLVYVLKGQTVLRSGTASTRADVEALVAAAKADDGHDEIEQPRQFATEGPSA
jgi:hypothetical protein